MGNAASHICSVNHETKVMIYGASSSGKASIEQAFEGDPAEQTTKAGGMKIFVIYHIVQTRPAWIEACLSRLKREPLCKVKEDVVFVMISIGDFDVDVEGTNSVVAGLEILKTILLDPNHATQSIVVYLNKYDLFTKKISESTVPTLLNYPCFQASAEDGMEAFTGPEKDVDAAFNFLEARVRALRLKVPDFLGKFDVLPCTATDTIATKRDSQLALKDYEGGEDLATRVRTQTSVSISSPLQRGSSPAATPITPAKSAESEKKKRASIFDFSQAYTSKDSFAM